ncbi:MAG TPA: hypothetical protein VH092_27825 [Urbifossiella sp.]|jgi:hypothetical protein|nr:hypothetical protein [Urbifossiella sp.]
MLPTPLTPEQQRQADQYAALFLQLAQREAQRFGERLARRPDHELLGPTEFDLRRLVHDLGAGFLAAALNEREKGVPGVECGLPGLHLGRPPEGPPAPHRARPARPDDRVPARLPRPGLRARGRPWDEVLGLNPTRQTPAAQEIIALNRGGRPLRRVGGHIRRLVVYLDNGPSNAGTRTPFLSRVVGFADATGLEVRLVYYPPYHRKYNPVERAGRPWSGSGGAGY